MKQTAILAALLSMMVFTSYRKHTLVGEGPLIDETRELAAFDEVQADGSLDVVVYPSTSNKVVVTGYHNLVPIFETDIVGGKLRLSYPDKYYNIRHNNIRVTDRKS